MSCTPMPPQPATASDSEPSPTAAKTSSVGLMVRLAWGLELFRTPTGDAYAVLSDGETLALSESAFRAWLTGELYREKKRSASASAVRDAVQILTGEARSRGIIKPVHVRVAAVDDSVVLDLGRDDRHALTIDRDGWRVGPAPAGVHLIRRPGMLPLPDPVRSSKTLSEILGRLLNVKSETDMMMFVAWLVAALRGRKPFPILTVKGEQGTAKSSGTRNARSFIDPSQADLSLTPRDPRDLMIAASNSYVIGYDNLSQIADWLSDALSALSTGTGLRTRALTTDREEAIFAAARPIVINGIPDLIRRGDFADRALVVELEPISEADRLTETEVRQRLTESQPEILGLLADAVAQAIRRPIRPKHLPRMADFVCVVESAAPALGWQPGAFVAAYAQSRRDAIETLLQDDPIAEGLEALRPRGGFRGSLSGLLQTLREVSPSHVQGELPKSPKGLANALKRLSPALRAQGIDYQPPRRLSTGSRERVCLIAFRPTSGPPSTLGHVAPSQKHDVDTPPISSSGKCPDVDGSCNSFVVNGGFPNPSTSKEPDSDPGGLESGSDVDGDKAARSVEFSPYSAENTPAHADGGAA